MRFTDIKQRVSSVFGSDPRPRGRSVQLQLERALRTRRDIDERVLNAMLNVPRHEFVLPSDLTRAAEDRALSIGSGQTISQPSLVGHMISKLNLPAAGARVLDLGCGSGYQAAILSHLADEVFTVERIGELAEAAKSRLSRLGYANVHVEHASADVLGYPSAAPYDGIIVGAGVPKIPKSLIDQLKLGARMIIPVGTKTRQRVTTATRKRTHVATDYGLECVFVPLIGPDAW